MVLAGVDFGLHKSQSGFTTGPMKDSGILLFMERNVLCLDLLLVAKPEV